MKLNHITFTGIDASTDLERVKDISARRECEWGVLFSRNRQGIDPRYPDMKSIERILSTGLTFAAHLCGKIAQQVMEAGNLGDFNFEGFARVQVNHTNPSPVVLARFSEAIGKPVIAQWRDTNAFPSEYEGVSWLFDPSGGNGLSPKEWPYNNSREPVGYAGGINPGNVASILETISSRSPAGFWIDMETGVRTDDLFDLDKVQAVIESVESKLSHCS